MTREEAEEYIREWCPYDRQEEIIKALEQKPCGDAISRQAAIDACLNGWNKDYKEIVEEIRVLPPVTPQQKMGRWVEEIISVGTRKVFCSECGCSASFEHVSNGDVYSASGYGVINKTKFCPNCGAKMQEVKE